MLDLFRGLSAVMVLLHHGVGMLWKAQTPVTLFHTVVGDIFGRGLQFVMVFFVLSGFVISSIVFRQIVSGQWSWRNYLIDRLTRLWLVLIPALILTYGLTHWAIPVELFTQRYLSPKVFFGNLFFLQGISVPMFGYNTPLWSLSYEFWFYLLFPCMVLVFTEKKWWLKALYALVAAGIAVLLGKALLWYGVWLLGVGVFLLPRVLVKEGRFPWDGLLLFIASLVTSKIIAPTDEWDLAANYIVGLGFAFFVYRVIQTKTSDERRLPGLGWIKALAGMSYTLYLIHYPMLNAARQKWIGEGFEDGLKGLAFVLLVCGAVFFLAWALAQVTEMHTGAAKKWVRQRLDRRAAMD